MTTAETVQSPPYAVPPESAFEENGYAGFLPAPDLKRLADRLIPNHELPIAGATNVIYLWRAEGGKHKGQPVYAKIQAPSGLLEHFSRADFVLWVAADHLRARKASARFVEAVLHHELLHVTEDEKGNLVLQGHGFEGFLREVELYADVVEELQAIVHTVRQMSLDEAVS